MSNRLEDLELYALAEAFSDEILVWSFNLDYFAKDTLGKQLVRAVDSIGANIAEDFGRYHFKENKNFCYFSRGSLIETKGWITKAKTRSLISEEQFNMYLNKLGVIHLKLNAYIKHIGNKIPPMTND